MSPFSRRRLRNAAMFALVAIPIVVTERAFVATLRRTELFTGCMLFGIVLVLSGYRLRKTVPFLPLGTSTSWVQFHIYAGLLSFVIFAVHAGLRVPTGTFETMLWALYLSVFLSGVIGLILSRTIPGRLTLRGQEVLFERIPIFVRQLRTEAEALVTSCVTDMNSTAIPEVYASCLHQFFQRPRNLVWHLAHSQRPRNQLLYRIRETERFLSKDEQHVLGDIAERVKVKDDLDYQYALQATLKYWLFLHIPLTWALLVFSLFHLIAAMAFTVG